MMTYEEFRKSVLDTALALGCDAAETVFVEGDRFQAGVLAQDSTAIPSAANSASACAYK